MALFWGCVSGWAQLSGLRDGDLMAPGAIEGLLLVPEGSDRSIKNVTVTLLKTRATAAADATGRFVFEEVLPGSYTLVAAGEGFSMLVITDVVVRPRRRVLLDAEEMPVAIREGDVYRMEPVVVSARKQLEALERYEITENRPQAFATANVDLPRTINDPQPYYLFDRRAIARAGAMTLEDFVQRRVPMDATKLRASDNVVTIATGLGVADNKSSINLNGLGPEHTVILLNGRRVPKYAMGGLMSTAVQADINGIPLAAIERVEILPASSSAAYGSDATGGAVNIVLRDDFRGAEIEVGVERPFDAHAPIYRAALTAGRTLNGGRTNAMLSVSRTKIEPLEYRHRRELLDAYRARAWMNDPEGAGAPSYANVPLGRTTNIVAMPVTRVVDGQVVTEPGALFGPGTSDRTFVPDGYTGGGGLEVFQENAGRLNLDPSPDGVGRMPFYALHSPLEVETTVTAAYAAVRHRVSLRAEVFGEFSHSENLGVNRGNPGYVTADLPATLPTNVFGVPVRVTARVEPELEPTRQRFMDDRIVVGMRVELPRDWVGQADAAWTSTRLRRTGGEFHMAGLAADAQSGQIDLLRDLRGSPIAFEDYVSRTGSEEGAWLGTVDLRASGPLARLPGGELLTTWGVGIEEDVRRDHVTWQTLFGAAGQSSPRRTEGGSQSKGHVYGEAWLPVVSQVNRRPGVAQLDLQLAGRAEWFDVRDVTDDGRDVAFDASSFTAGVRYRPVRDVMLRASFGTGFRAPDLAELRPMQPPLPVSPISPNGWLPVPVRDPKRGSTIAQGTASLGGSPDVRPERSENVTLGLVVEPRILPGLRVAFDSTVVRRRDEIRTFGWQTIVDNEELFPGRVIRGSVPPGDPYGVGPITFVDGTMMNVFDARSVNYNVSVDFERATERAGRWQFFVLGNTWQHYTRKIDPGSSMVEQINSRGPFTQGQPKFMVNGGVGWTGGSWTAGWVVRFYGHHRVHETMVKANGGEFVDEQMFHDVFGGYSFPVQAARGRARMLSGIEVQVGAKNVFNTPPRFDGSTTRFYSPYGDIRRGSVYLTVRKRF